MNDKPTTFESGLEGNASSSSKRGMKFDLNSVLSISGYFKSEVILLNDDSEMEGSFSRRDSL